MILTDSRILEEMAKGTIKIEPYTRADLGSNSYDVHLGKTLATYVNAELDAKNTTRSNISRSPMKALYYSHMLFI
jgi:dCTP deaminase